jgi:ribosomal protein S18 acetylase RimI-like enzyme
MENLEIRLAQLADFEDIAEISRFTYQENYINHPANSPEDEINLLAYMAANFSPEAIHSNLQKPEICYWIIKEVHQIIAYAKLIRNYRTEKLPHQAVICLDKLYVLKNQQGRQLGRVLLEKCLETAQNEKFDLLWLCVWSENKPAMSFYEKFDFEYGGNMPFQMGNTVYEDILMVKNLR